MRVKEIYGLTANLLRVLRHCQVNIEVRNSPRHITKPNAVTPEERKMSSKPEKESAENKPEDLEIKIVPEGTFAGHIDKPELVKEGEVIPEDTGDQGGGQS